MERKGQSLDGNFDLFDSKTFQLAVRSLIKEKVQGLLLSGVLNFIIFFKIVHYLNY